MPRFNQTLDFAVRGVEYFNNQDLPTNTAVQRGLSSRYAPRGRYSWQEGVLASFNSWLIDRYRITDETDIPVRVRR